MDIGLKIKNIRLNKGISQDELANTICKSRSSLQKYENGEVAITVDILEDIANALNIDVVEFFSDDVDDILNLIVKRFGLKDVPMQQLEYDFKLMMDLIKLRYK
ncbi:MAG: helix-turn-helix domain-containing protein [Cellulosilyticaceae bacterium]